MGRKSKRARPAIEQRRGGGQRYEKYLSASSADQSINEISPNTTSLTMTSIENEEWTPMKGKTSVTKKIYFHLLR